MLGKNEKDPVNESLQSIHRNCSLPRGDDTAERAFEKCKGMKSIQSLNVYSTNVQ